MDCVMTGQPLNLAGMMIGYMAEAATKKRSTLPYGMVLTVVFQSQGVNILENEPQKKLRHTDYYNASTLHRMGFRKVNGQWQRRRHSDGAEQVREVRAEADIEFDEDIPGPSAAGPSVPQSSTGPSSSAPPPTPAVPTGSFPGSSAFSDVQIEQLKALLAEQEDRLKNNVRVQLFGIEQLVHTLEEKVDKIENSIGNSSNTLKTELQVIFDKIKDIGGDSDIYSKCNAELQEKVTSAEKLLNEFMHVQKDGIGRILTEIRSLIALRLK